MPSHSPRTGGPLRAGVAALTALTFSHAQVAFAVDPAPPASADINTASPIKHVVVVIGENRTFDHIYGTYRPKNGHTISNLLSKGIVNPDGSPGPNFALAKQFIATFQDSYFIASNEKTPYSVLPAPTLNGAPASTSPSAPPFSGLTDARLAAIEPSLGFSDRFLLTTGATGGPTTGPDRRIANSAKLPNGPFQLTGPHLPYDAYTGDTTHRFYQMWQQSDCSVANATAANPAGCLNDLYPWVITTYAGDNDKGGGMSMAFYNLQEGDAPLFNRLADEYTISDNYHQPAMGGTGIQHVFLGTGDDIFWSDGMGNPTAPPASVVANPNPTSPGTNNLYTLDGQAGNCSNFSAPGVAPIAGYLNSLPYQLRYENGVTNCAQDRYYMLNNINPGYLPNGQPDPSAATGGAIPPSRVRTIGDALNAKGISWAYYGGAYNAAVNLATGSKNPADAIGTAYCTICNFAAYATSIMANPAQRQAHIKDATDFFTAVNQGSLPAVSFIKPDELLDGHPATSKLDLLEAMIAKILDALDRRPALQAKTAVFITFDEGGGYYDSGYIQPLDFFGDGPRIPLIVVSPYSKGGHVVHSYNDHVSILKFIERNWHLNPLTERSRDNLPNPVAERHNPYVPRNSPAIGDLFDTFQFDKS
jgi:phospholipase C